MQNRRSLLTAAGGVAAASLVASRAFAQDTSTSVAPPTSISTVPTDPFIVLLHGVYVPVSDGPNLGLSGVNLSDGTYSRTRIYSVFGLPDPQGQDEIEANKVPTRPIGNFYVQFSVPIPGALCAYDLPNGAIAMRFDSGALTPRPDGKGGNYLQGTFELTITDANGIYKDFKGGHNHMVDRLHQLADTKFDEFCFCNISQYQYP